ncbi:MAG: hypothetical protein ACR2JF_08070 [Iamia sp.]
MGSKVDVRALADAVYPLAEAGASDAEAARAVLVFLGLAAEGPIRLTYKRSQAIDAALRQAELAAPSG